jgi:hypothetical protein
LASGEPETRLAIFESLYPTDQKRDDEMQARDNGRSRALGGGFTVLVAALALALTAGNAFAAPSEKVL